MGYSSLVNYKKISPNKNSPRNETIKRITIHHMAGNMSAKACCDYFASTTRQVSANYTIGTDGQVGLSVDEKDRAWTSGSPSNDHQAITIEVANDGGNPDWHVSDKALAKLIELCADICKRYGKSKLLWFGDKDKTLNYTPKSNEMVITIHKWFAATGCPGPYLESKMSYIADEVTKKLSTTTSSKPASSKLKEGDIVKITGSKYYNGKNIPSWVKNLKWVVYSVSGDRVVINVDTSNKYAIMSAVKSSDVSLVSAAAETKPSNQTTVKTYKKGDAVKLVNAPLYAFATDTKVRSKKKGTFYVYDGEVLKGRIRITILKAFCGKKPAAVFVTGWINISDIK